jgi:hypothetical protein
MGIDCGNSRLNAVRHGGDFEMGYAALAEKETI